MDGLLEVLKFKWEVTHHMSLETFQDSTPLQPRTQAPCESHWMRGNELATRGWGIGSHKATAMLYSTRGVGVTCTLKDTE
jgi:hypothetical protein